MLDDLAPIVTFQRFVEMVAARLRLLACEVPPRFEPGRASWAALDCEVELVAFDAGRARVLVAMNRVLLYASEPSAQTSRDAAIYADAISLWLSGPRQADW